MFCRLWDTFICWLFKKRESTSWVFMWPFSFVDSLQIEENIFAKYNTLVIRLYIVAVTFFARSSSKLIHTLCYHLWYTNIFLHCFVSKLERNPFSLRCIQVKTTHGSLSSWGYYLDPVTAPGKPLLNTRKRRLNSTGLNYWSRGTTFV